LARELTTDPGRSSGNQDGAFGKIANTHDFTS
jgi:hypothetical protein